MKKYLLIVLITVLCGIYQVSVAFSQTRADDIVGYYFAYDPRTNERNQMEIFRLANGTYDAKVVWVENKSLSHQIGRTPVRNLSFDPKNDDWRNGKVTVNGKDYSMMANFTDDGRLRLRGFFGVSLLGKTVYWTKETELRK